MPVDCRILWDEEQIREPRIFEHEAAEGMAGVQHHTRVEEEADPLPSCNDHVLHHSGHDDPLQVDKTVVKLSLAMVDLNQMKSLRNQEEGEGLYHAAEAVGVQKHSYVALLPGIHEECVHPMGASAEAMPVEKIQ